MAEGPAVVYSVGPVPPLPGPDNLRFVPLGGLGEIGMNCFALEQSDGILVVDCGTAFPHVDLGIDVIHADYSWLVERAERVSGVFITHGHEDHIGGLPYLLSGLDVPVWGPPHALGLARRRLAEHDFLPGDVPLNVAIAGERYQVGPFEVEPVRVAHSIVEASALRIATAAGTVVHTGDFNFDPDPPDGEPSDEARLRAIGDEGVALLLSDSTNVDVTERVGSEKSVAEALAQLIAGADQCVFIAMFASNIQRLIMLGDIAQQTGRKICLLGRSLNTQVEVATAIGRLAWPSDLRVAAEQARSVPREQLLVLAGGSQAEPNSAMARLAQGTHQHMSVEAGDTVVMSSRIIPGNDRLIFDMMCDLMRRGARVHTRGSDPGVHTSGHAGRSEQRHMLELIRPRAFVPVHGTLHHLTHHAELARSLGVEQVEVVENGTPVRLADGRLHVEDPVPHGRVNVALGGSELSDETLRRRAELARSGVVSVVLALDDALQVVAGPSVRARGVPGVDDEPAALAAIADEVVRTLDRVRGWRGLELEDELRRGARRAVYDLAGFRPVVEVQLLGTGG